MFVSDKRVVYPYAMRGRFWNDEINTKLKINVMG